MLLQLHFMYGDVKNVAAYKLSKKRNNKKEKFLEYQISHGSNTVFFNI